MRRAPALLAALACVAAGGDLTAVAVAAPEGGPAPNTPAAATTSGTSTPSPTTVTARSTATPPPASTTPGTIVPGASSGTPGANLSGVRVVTVPAHTGTAASRAHGSSGTSGIAIALAIVGVLLILLAGAWALLRSRSSDPHWLLSLRHSLAEASHRAGNTWAEFTDWARLGR